MKNGDFGHGKFCICPLLPVKIMQILTFKAYSSSGQNNGILARSIRPKSELPSTQEKDPHHTLGRSQNVRPDRHRQDRLQKAMPTSSDDPQGRRRPATRRKVEIRADGTRISPSKAVRPSPPPAPQALYASEKPFKKKSVVGRRCPLRGGGSFRYGFRIGKFCICGDSGTKRSKSGSLKLTVGE